MNNKRIVSGYDVELQLSPDKLYKLIKPLVEKKFVNNDYIKKVYNISLEGDKGKIVIADQSLPVFEFPFIYHKQNEIERSHDILKITLSIETKDGNINIKAQLIADLYWKDPFIKLALKDAIIVKTISSDIITNSKLIGIAASDGYADTIALLANIDFAKLLEQKMDLPTKVKERNPMSFLPSNADYAIGINPYVYEFIKAYIKPLVEEEIQKIKELKGRGKYSGINFEYEKNCIWLIAKGYFDVPHSDPLDVSFRAVVALKFKVGEDGFLQVCCNSVDVKLDYNAWYTILGFLIGGFAGLGGAIVGAHANSIAELTFKDYLKKAENNIKVKILSPNNYHYCNANGVAKLHQQDGMLNTLNCFLREPIKLSGQDATSILYQIWQGIYLKVSGTLIDNNGISMWGTLPVIDNCYVCNDVTLCKIKYFKNGKEPLLVYRDTQNKEEEIDINTAVQYIKDTERPDKETTDKSQNTNKVRSAYGQLPQNFLPFPVAVYKESNEIVAYEFSNGLIAKKNELIELYIHRIVMIKGLTLRSRNGKKYFTTKRDDFPENNLSSLPPIDKSKMENLYYDN